MDPSIGPWTNFLNGGEGVPGLEEFSFPLTQETPDLNDMASGGSPTEEVQMSAPTSSAPRSERKGVAKRSKNFLKEENKVVVEAWLKVGKDPIHGAYQTRSTFWGRIHQYFEAHKTTSASRSESSIMHRWSFILCEVNKFCQCYGTVSRRNPSGATIQDKIAEAMTMYTRLDEPHHRSFSLMHCWVLLKDTDKWKAKQKEMKEPQKTSVNKKQKTKVGDTPGSVQAIDADEVQEVAAAPSEEQKRPIGQKKAKEAIRRQRGMDAYVEAMDRMWAKKEALDNEKERKKDERFQASMEVEKQRLAIEAKKAEAELIEKEDRIMSMDLSTLTPIQQQYYSAMQEQIVQRRLAN